jgi:CheY-like chemotaxis protein/HPt (histidine-containing phosphotransfer) domain-containing protein
LGGRFGLLLAIGAAAFVLTIARIALDGTHEALALAGIVTLVFGMTALAIRNCLRDAFDRVAQMKLQLTQERAATEAARAQTERAHRSKSRFFAAAGHELRTPLTGVIGVIDLLRYEGEHSERVRSLLDVAAASGEALLARVNDVLNLRHTETDRFGSAPADADLHALTLRARVATRDASAASGDEPLPAHAWTLQVLLADDNATNQFVIACYLQGWGHEVQCVEDGCQALAACGERHFDLVLLDGFMPGLCGPEVLQRLRQPGEADASPFNRDVFVAGVSANSAPEDRAEFEQRGAQAFVAKPVHAPLLHRVVQGAIDHQQARGIALAPNPRAASLSRDALDQLLAMPASVRDAERSARFRARFMHELPAQARRLQRACNVSDLAELAEVAHALKGASGYAGLPVLTQLAAQTEVHARAGRVPSAWASARSLQQAIIEINSNKEAVE